MRHAQGRATDGVRKDLRGLKKKVDTQLEEYFPSIFVTANTKEFYDRLKQRTVLILKHIISSIDIGSEVSSISDKLIGFNAPTAFDNGDFERKFDKEFETMCLIISKETNANVKKMTVLEYYNAYEFIQKKEKERRKAYESHRRAH